MLTFTNLEKAAVANVSAAMQCADGKSDPKEYALNLLFMTRFDITSSELNQAQEMELFDAMTVLKMMTDDKKRCVSAILGSIILVDGDVDDREVSLWRLISSICKFPTMSLAEAPNIMKEYL